MFSDALIQHIRDVKRTSITMDASRLEVVIANLTFLHDSVVASEQLLLEAAYWTDRLPGSQFRDRLAEYYRCHLEEERDELKWLRHDLKSVGVSPDIPNLLAMAMVGTQYYLLKHVHPVTLLGYMAVVEGDPTPIEVVNFMERAHGKGLLHFVHYHAIADLEHRKELLNIIDSAPAPNQDQILHSTDNVLDYLIRAAATWRLIPA